MPLTDTQISKARAKGKTRKLADSRGLVLELAPSGSKLWRYRYRINGKENVFAAGEYCQAPIGETDEQARVRIASGRMTLSEARIEREKWRALVKSGRHPAHERKATKLRQASEGANTFQAVAREWMDRCSSKWSTSYAERVKRRLEDEVFPYIGALPISAITAAHLLPIIQGAEQRGAEVVALLIRQLCSQVFRFAAATLRVDSDPAAALKGAVSRPAVQHRKPLPVGEIPVFVKALDAYSGTPTTKIALRLLLLTFVRPSEMAGSEWSEIDLDAALWRIPASRMKGRRDHVVPLSSQAIALLRELQKLTGTQRHLFPNRSRPRHAMSTSTFNAALVLMGYGGRLSAHGFRSTASTILNELGYRSDVIERQLAHDESNQVRASYNRAEYLEERRAMMQHWADFIDSLCAGENVIGFRRAAA